MAKPPLFSGTEVGETGTSSKVFSVPKIGGHGHGHELSLQQANSIWVPGIFVCRYASQENFYGRNGFVKDGILLSKLQICHLYKKSCSRVASPRFSFFAFSTIASDLRICAFAAQKG